MVGAVDGWGCGWLGLWMVGTWMVGAVDGWDMDGWGCGWLGHGWLGLWMVGAVDGWGMDGWCVNGWCVDGWGMDGWCVDGWCVNGWGCGWLGLWMVGALMVGAVDGWGMDGWGCGWLGLWMVGAVDGWGVQCCSCYSCFATVCSFNKIRPFFPTEFSKKKVFREEGGGGAFTFPFFFIHMSNMQINLVLFLLQTHHVSSCTFCIDRMERSSGDLCSSDVQRCSLSGVKLVALGHVCI